MPINHCLGGKDFIDFHWCDDIRKGNEKLNFVDSVGDSTRLMQAYIMKKSQPYFDDLPDIAVIMVSQCTEKYQTDLSRQTSCINEATKEFISRANTCSGMPTKTGIFKDQGTSGGAFCRGSQSYTVKTAFTEVPASMPTPNWLKECTKAVDDENYYYFDTNAPKFQGFYHPLFYQSHSFKINSKEKTVNPGNPIESDPSMNISNWLQSPQFTVDNDPLFQETKEYHVKGNFNDLWDYEEAYLYNPECERNQFLFALKDYPSVKIASGGDFRFDASRDGCSNEVKRGKHSDVFILNPKV